MLEEYRRLVRAAVFPDPFSQRPIRLRDGTTTIAEYKRATGDLAGTVDLMQEFVEDGTQNRRRIWVTAKTPTLPRLSAK
jgi:hypothetical protein